MMRVLIIGAGPAGLSFAANLAQSGIKHEITVVDRRSQGEAPGWGVTLRTPALSFLDLAHHIPYQNLTGRACWSCGERVVNLPYPENFGLATVSRAELQDALTNICIRAGIRISYDVDAAQLSESDLRAHDLVVAADGAHSTIRQRHAAQFNPTITLSHNHYCWLATDRPFDTLTILLEQQPLPLLAWAYAYAPNMSTLIVEASKNTIDDSGLSQLSRDETCAAVARNFESVFGAARVLAGPSVRWHAFPTITCERLTYRNIVLIGDAAHTAHFSQGFGTLFAFDDAIALTNALQSSPNLELALEAYNEERRPKIAEWQDIACASMRWSEETVRALEARDEAKVRAQIEERWPNNEIPPAPMDSYGS